MKALVIDVREGGDWSMDLLFAGLVRNLGYKNVVMHPVKQKHLCWDGQGDWGKERRSFGHTEYNHLVQALTDRQVKLQGATNEITHAFLDERMESYQQYLQLGLQHTKVKVVVVAGHDSFQNQSPEFVKSLYGKQFHMMFLDNWCNDDYKDLPWARLMNHSANWDHFWDYTKRCLLLENKEFDICFMGYNSHPVRNVVISHIESNWKHLNNRIVFERQPNTTEKFVSHKEFFETVARSKIAISIRGAARGGWASRFYQIPYVGSFMLSSTFPGKQLHPFENDVHCRYFNTLEQLDQQISWALENDFEREFIAKAGHDHCMEFHTATARMRYVINEVTTHG